MIFYWKNDTKLCQSIWATLGTGTGATLSTRDMFLKKHMDFLKHGCKASKFKYDTQDKQMWRKDTKTNVV